MSDQVAVLESIRDVLSGKVPTPAAETPSPEDEEEILDLTKLVNDDGSITDLDAIDDIAASDAEQEITNESIKEEEMANVSTTAGDDVLDEIDRLLADESSGTPDNTLSEEAGETIDEMIEPIKTISSDTLEFEISNEPKAEDTNFEASFEQAESETIKTTENEEIMTENNNQVDENNDDSLISDASADRAKSSIGDLLKVTGQSKAAHAPSTPAPSFRNGDTLEDLVMESLKPMLAKWLDENLNSLVEEIVQKEISRIIPR